MDTFELGLLILGLKGKSLLDYTNLFSPNECQKKDNFNKYQKKDIFIDLKLKI